MADAALVALAERLQGVCIARGVTVATAESCTGGLIAEAITSVPGSSGYFLGGIVAYADTVKAGTLGVSEGVLAAHGAVSAQVALAMASGARERLGASLAVSVTGVAGPDGGSDAKPVGLTYVGLAAPGANEVRKFVFASERAGNRDAATIAALEWLIEATEQLEHGR
jgi:competence/damage-inducible protein CinA C-terminal domain